MAQKEKGVVYILETPYGIKIGRTNSFHRRLKQLSAQYEVKFIHAIGTHDMVNLERTLHERFRIRRIPGTPSTEIFALTLADVEQIKAIEKFAGVPCQHFHSLTDLVKHSIAMYRQFYLVAPVGESNGKSIREDGKHTHPSVRSASWAGSTDGKE